MYNLGHWQMSSLSYWLIKMHNFAAVRSTTCEYTMVRQTPARQSEHIAAAGETLPFTQPKNPCTLNLWRRAVASSRPGGLTRDPTPSFNEAVSAPRSTSPGNSSISVRFWYTPANQRSHSLALIAMVRRGIPAAAQCIPVGYCAPFVTYNIWSAVVNLWKHDAGRRCDFSERTL